MSIIYESTNDVTLTLNGRTINDFDLNGDLISVSYSNPETFRINATGGGLTTGSRLDADVATIVLRVQQLSDDDVFFNEALGGDFPTVFNGSIKKPYQRDGKFLIASWSLENGTITTKPAFTHNGQDGSALSEWTLEFRKVTRSI